MYKHDYKHTVQYYETDKMGVTHHSNYIRWMEEARGDFLEKNGIGYAGMEEKGIVSPVVSINCDYRRTTTYADTIDIELWIKEYDGVKLTVSYDMKLDGQTVFTAESSHCFLTKEGKIVILKKKYPEYDTILNKLKG